MFAQNLGEYGLLQSMSSAVVRLSDTIGTWVSNAGPGTWVVVGLVVLGGLWSLRSRGPRR